MPGGRPNSYNEETARKLCAKLSIGESLRTATKGDDMPCIETVFSWMRKYPEFLEQYEKAKQEAADMFTEDMLDIAQDQSLDTQRARLMVDTRKWIASKLKPKKYGERIEQDLTSKGERIFVLPSELIKKNEIPDDSYSSSIDHS